MGALARAAALLLFILPTSSSVASIGVEAVFVGKWDEDQLVWRNDGWINGENRALLGFTGPSTDNIGELGEVANAAVWEVVGEASNDPWVSVSHLRYRVVPVFRPIPKGLGLLKDLSRKDCAPRNIGSLARRVNTIFMLVFGNSIPWIGRWGGRIDHNCDVHCWQSSSIVYGKFNVGLPNVVVVQRNWFGEDWLVGIYPRSLLSDHLIQLALHNTALTARIIGGDHDCSDADRRCSPEARDFRLPEIPLAPIFGISLIILALKLLNDTFDRIDYVFFVGIFGGGAIFIIGFLLVFFYFLWS